MINATLHWHGYRNRETKLILEDGTNLFTALMVSSVTITFDADDCVVHLTSDTNFILNAPIPVKVSVAFESLRAIAASHGYELMPIARDSDS